MHDYSEFEDAPEDLGENAMARLAGLAKDQLSAEALVASLEERLADAKEALNQIEERDLPKLMEALNLTKFTTSNGLEIQIGEKIRGSIPKGNEEPAFAWLNDNGHGNIIKRMFAIEFGKDDEKWANKFEGDLKKRKKPLNVKRKKSVHTSTLQSFIKGQLEEGVPIPLDIFGAFRQKFTKVRVPK